MEAVRSSVSAAAAASPFVAWRLMIDLLPGLEHLLSDSPALIKHRGCRLLSGGSGTRGPGNRPGAKESPEPHPEPSAIHIFILHDVCIFLLGYGGACFQNIHIYINQ